MLTKIIIIKCIYTVIHTCTKIMCIEALKNTSAKTVTLSMFNMLKKNLKWIKTDTGLE